MNSHRNNSGTESVIHVLVVNLTGVIAEMIQQTLQQQSDIQLLGEVKTWENIDDTIVNADVVVLGVNDVYSPPDVCFRLLNHYPNLKILLLTTTRDEAIAYWRTLYCHPMQVTSSQSLVEAIRQICSLSSL